MVNKLRNFFRMPPEIREDFWHDALRHNAISMMAICVIVLATEVYNIARVALLSQSGLSTLNNRIYFGMYLALLLAALLYLALRLLLRGRSRQARWAMQYSMVLFTLVWHAALNAYDALHHPPTETIVYITAVLAMGVLIQMPPAFSVPAHVLAYGVFMASAWSVLNEGTRLNLTVTSIVALALSLTNYHHVVVVVSQRLEINRMNRQLQVMLQKDPLTGLLNKGAFPRQVELHLESSPAPEETALLILDLDDFKSVNDRYGHPCGDFVLKETALRLQALAGDSAGRIGGDEFAVVLSGPDAELQRLGEALLREVASIRWKGQDVGARCSVGICRAGRPGVEYERLYREADKALYRAKGQGKDRCCLCTAP